MSEFVFTNNALKRSASRDPMALFASGGNCAALNAAYLTVVRCLTLPPESLKRLDSLRCVLSRFVLPCSLSAPSSLKAGKRGYLKYSSIPVPFPLTLTNTQFEAIEMNNATSNANTENVSAGTVPPADTVPRLEVYHSQTVSSSVERLS